MTQNQFIQDVIDEVTVSGMIPVPLQPKEIERNIKVAANWFYPNYYNSVETAYYVLKLSAFQTAEFRQTRKIILPECVQNCFGVREINGFNRLGNIDKDFAEDRLIASEIFISSAHGDGLVMRTAQSMYYDLSKAFMVDMIGFEFNNNTNAVTIRGRDPRFDVLFTVANRIPLDRLLEDYYFSRYVTCLSKLSVVRAIGYVDFKFAGNHSINVDKIQDEATKELEEIKQAIDKESPPDFFYIFH